MALSRSFQMPKPPRNPASGDPPVTTTASDQQIVPHHLPSAPALRAADQGVADALESGVRPLRRHPPRLRRPVASLHRLVRRGGVSRVKYICRALPQIGRYRKERFT